MFARWKAENYGSSPQSDHVGTSGITLPESTSRPLDKHNPLLAMTIRNWMKKRGKTVKPKLTEEQTTNLKMCFKMMDADGSGAIDTDELLAAFRLLGIKVSRKEVEAMLNEVDRDGSGEVEYAEFLEIMTVQLNKMAEDKDNKSGKVEQRTEGEGRTREDNLGTPNAASLPFDVVATAYRRKKLLDALEKDNKGFLRSVAEEEARKRAEHLVQQQQQQTPQKQDEVASWLLQYCRSSSTLRRRKAEAGFRVQNLSSPQHNTEFLQSLAQRQKQISDALTYKYRKEINAPSKAASDAWQRQQREIGQSPNPPKLSASAADLSVQC